MFVVFCVIALFVAALSCLTLRYFVFHYVFAVALFVVALLDFAKSGIFRCAVCCCVVWSLYCLCLGALRFHIPSMSSKIKRNTKTSLTSS